MGRLLARVKSVSAAKKKKKKKKKKRGGNFFFFFFFESGLKLDEKSIENGLEGQKCSVGGLFWGWLPPP